MLLTTSSALSDLATYLSSLTSVFSTLFTAAWDLLSTNWFLLGVVGIPLISGILFSIISFFRSKS